MKSAMIRNIPDEIHKEFRIMCLEKGVSMNSELVRLMKQAVEEYKKRKL